MPAQEGRFLNHLMFIMSGHCAATKRVAPQVRRRRTELLPSPLRGASAAGRAHGAADAPAAEEVELEVFPAPAFTGITFVLAFRDSCS